MYKIICTFKDKSSVTYKCKEDRLYEYADRHLNSVRIDTIFVQMYPLKHNPLIDWVGRRNKKKKVS